MKFLRRAKRPAVVAHAKHDDAEAVVAALHVLVCPAKEGGFLAQGIEINYLATGDTEEEAKEHFAEGFTRTIMAYLELRRPLDGLFKTKTPSEYVMKYYEGTSRPSLHCVVSRRKVDIPENVPVPRDLAFLSAATAAA